VKVRCMGGARGLQAPAGGGAWPHLRGPRLLLQGNARPVGGGRPVHDIAGDGVHLQALAGVGVEGEGGSSV
jgi:hypothetical protein